MLYRSAGTAYTMAPQTIGHAGPTVFDDHGTLFLEGETVARFLDFAQDSTVPKITARRLYDFARFRPTND